MFKDSKMQVFESNQSNTYLVKLLLMEFSLFGHNSMQKLIRDPKLLDGTGQTFFGGHSRLPLGSSLGFGQFPFRRWPLP